MKHTVPTLAALALVGAVAPATYGVSIKDDVLSLGIGARLQTTAQMNDATNTTGGDYRISGGAVGAVDDPVDFYIHRARLYFNIKYGANWKGQVAINADNVDRDSTGASRAVVIRYAWLERSFDLGEGMNHAIHFGLDKPNQNPSDKNSSSRHLFPNQNAAASYLAPRGVGLGYIFNHPVFQITADLQNNTNSNTSVTPAVGAAKDNTGTNAQETEGFYYGIRAEFSFAPDWFIKKRADSFVGKEGQGLNIGLSYGTNQDHRIADADTVTAAGQPGTTSLTAYGVDVMLWMNNLSAYAEYRTGTTENERNDGVAVVGPLDTDAEFIVVQLAYAFPIGDEFLEPAIRYQIIDTNTDVDETVNYGNMGQSGGAGTQIDIGLNYYLNGHDNKISLALSLWESEEGQGDATIVRLQHQLNF